MHALHPMQLSMSCSHSRVLVFLHVNMHDSLNQHALTIAGV